MSDDWTVDMFPGAGEEIPSDEERDKADKLIADWAKVWREEVVTIDRVHPAVAGGSPWEGKPTNRAFLRSRVRRWWFGKARPLAEPS